MGLAWDAPAGTKVDSHGVKAAGRNVAAEELVIVSVSVHCQGVGLCRYPQSASQVIHQLAGKRTQGGENLGDVWFRHDSSFDID